MDRNLVYNDPVSGDFTSCCCDFLRLATVASHQRLLGISVAQNNVTCARIDEETGLR